MQKRNTKKSRTTTLPDLEKYGFTYMKHMFSEIPLTPQKAAGLAATASLTAADDEFRVNLRLILHRSDSPTIFPGNPKLACKKPIFVPFCNNNWLWGVNPQSFRVSRAAIRHERRGVCVRSWRAAPKQVAGVAQALTGTAAHASGGTGPCQDFSPGHCNRQARPHPADECYGAASASHDRDTLVARPALDFPMRQCS